MYFRMIMVCDCIMGTGKSSAAINYMNAHSDQKFIYITPYLDETERIQNACPQLHFVKPFIGEDENEVFHTKIQHTNQLVEAGANITTTHQAFKRYDQTTLDNIHEKGYTLIIDESVSVLDEFTFNPDDLNVIERAGYVQQENDVYRLTDSSYDGDALKDMFKLLTTRELVRIRSSAKESLLYWTLPLSLFQAFKDVYVLTYLFEGQGLYHFFKLYGMQYKNIGVRLDEDGQFQFSDTEFYVPEYVSHLGEMVEIVDDAKLNRIGDDWFAISKNWFATHEGDVEQLQKNIYNCVNNRWRGTPPAAKLWTSYKAVEGCLRGKGYARMHTPFNLRATNKYKDCHYLAYCLNLFMPYGERMFYNKNRISINEELYALSSMVQWIWRSAIRDGSKIYIYIPSKRMRNLLKLWIQRTSEGRGFKADEKLRQLLME